MFSLRLKKIFLTLSLFTHDANAKFRILKVFHFCQHCKSIWNIGESRFVNEECFILPPLLGVVG